MNTVTVVGTLRSQTELEVFGHCIAVSELSRKRVGDRLKCEGLIMSTPGRGAFLQVLHYERTTEADANECVISGMVVGVLDPIKHPKHGRTACVIIKQSRSKTSRVLLTVIGSRIDELDVGNLSTGQQISVRGYILYHSKGLHVLYRGKEVSSLE